jgi:hypothetical protein
MLIMDYLNWDKYLLVQWVMKTLNKQNSVEWIAYLDWALSRIDGLLIMLGKFIKAKKEEEQQVT